jgi:hypothetical protein
MDVNNQLHAPVYALYPLNELHSFASVVMMEKN